MKCQDFFTSWHNFDKAGAFKNILPLQTAKCCKSEVNSRKTSELQAIKFTQNS